jgi:hypothetical protein
MLTYRSAIPKSPAKSSVTRTAVLSGIFINKNLKLLLINHSARKVDVLFHFPSRSQNTWNRTYGKTSYTPKDLRDYDKIIRAPASNEIAALQDDGYPTRLVNGNFAGKQHWTDRCLLASQSQNISCNTLLDGWQIALLCMNTPSISMVTYPGEHFAWRHSQRVNIKLKPGRLSYLVSYWFINTT